MCFSDFFFLLFQLPLPSTVFAETLPVWLPSVLTTVSKRDLYLKTIYPTSSSPSLYHSLACSATPTLFQIMEHTKQKEMKNVNNSVFQNFSYQFWRWFRKLPVRCTPKRCRPTKGQKQDVGIGLQLRAEADASCLWFGASHEVPSFLRMTNDIASAMAEASWV